MKISIQKIIKTIVPDPQNYTVILRFLGTTPTSSNITSTLNSIIYQLSRLFDIKAPEKKITSKPELEVFMTTLLINITRKFPHRKIVIVLDSLDQLNPSDYSLNWILSTLPYNVKMIFSTLPSHGSILDQLKKDRNLRDKIEENFLEIKSLDTQIVQVILKDWLKKSKRSITESQWNCLIGLFSDTNVRLKLYPLYIKLIFDIISKWESYHQPEGEFRKDCTTIDNCIKYLFKSFEKKHGILLFSRSIIYMTSFKNGISESEIEDILSLDDDVLYDIFEFHAPPVRKLPIALWARIKSDLNEYIVEKEVDDTRVIYW